MYQYFQGFLWEIPLSHIFAMHSLSIIPFIPKITIQITSLIVGLSMAYKKQISESSGALLVFNN